MTIPSSRRAAITGYGCLTALGVESSSTWQSLIQGMSARVPITAIPVQGCRVTEGAQATLPNLPHLSAKQVARMSRASRLIHPAAREALAQADLLSSDGRCKFPRLETSISTTACGMEKGEQFLHAVWNDQRGNRAALLAHYQAQQQIGELQRCFNFYGPTTVISNACAGGANAIGHAADLIRSGMADIVLAGGYDALCELVYCGFDSLLTLAPELCRPFDRGRNGLMIGEGAAFLVLESEEHALRRGATIHGIIAGYGHTTDTFHLTQPHQEGVALERAMQQALDQARLPASDIGYINAHGTGTPINDGSEAKAFTRLFPASTRLSSTKAAIGHTLGAAGAIEAVFSLLALKTGSLPPQLNLLDPLPDVAAMLVEPGEQHSLRSVMSVNLGFGGSNAALILTHA